MAQLNPDGSVNLNPTSAVVDTASTHQERSRKNKTNKRIYRPYRVGSGKANKRAGASPAVYRKQMIAAQTAEYQSRRSKEKGFDGRVPVHPPKRPLYTYMEQLLDKLKK